MPKSLFNISAIKKPDKNSERIRLHKWRIGTNHGDKLFDSYKAAQRYQAELNRHLDLKVRESNRLASMIYTDYRTLWFSLPYLTTVAVARDFQNYDKQMNLLMVRFSKRGFFDAILWIQKLNYNLGSILTLMEGVNLSHNTEMRHRLKMHRNDLDRIDKEVTDFAWPPDEGDYIGNHSH